MPTKQGKKQPKADKQAKPETGLDLSGKARRSRSGQLKDENSPLRMRIAFRRNLVAQLYLTGSHTIDTIKQYLEETFDYKISRIQIADDLKKSRESWRVNEERTTAEHLKAELDKLQELELFCMEQLRTSIWSQEKFTQEVVRVMKRRHAILGLDKTNIQVNDRRTADLSDAELALIAKGGKDADVA